MARGDHLKADRGLIEHHGIDCGNGTVIHYTHATGPHKAEIRRDSIEVFARGDHYEPVIYPRGTCFSPGGRSLCISPYWQSAARGKIR